MLANFTSKQILAKIQKEQPIGKISIYTQFNTVRDQKYNRKLLNLPFTHKWIKQYVVLGLSGTWDLSLQCLCDGTASQAEITTIQTS